jgi:hypothetical protein
MGRYQRNHHDRDMHARNTKSPQIIDSFRGKLKPGIGMISESDQPSKSDHKGKTPSTPATSLHVDRRWQSAALDISSAVDCPKTPMREESERGKSPRFEWVKKKIPFVKKR